MQRERTAPQIAPCSETGPSTASRPWHTELSPQQWRSGAAAWLGWLFDGLDMHLYTLVATPFVALLLAVEPSEQSVGRYGSIIQAAFLVGWALGGGLFGRLGDLLGRSRALMLTILTYALFTGLSAAAQSWWHLMCFRFLAALGIGGEWAVGASLLVETWPVRWRPWIAAVLQSAVNVGIMLACAAGYLMADLPHRYVFLVGILPAFLVLWIRRAVPEPEAWQSARREAAQQPRIRDLFGRAIRRTTLLSIVVCGSGLAAHWAFMFWYQRHLHAHPDVVSWGDAEKTRLVSLTLWWLMFWSIVGNFAAGALAMRFGYRRAICGMFAAYGVALAAAYAVPHGLPALAGWMAVCGVCQGAFGLFTMYLPPLFPTL
ncbi:MAG: MFS transporter, partial [Pirellulales bacterium]|nr:MFS transporter [Pirellulales bacterium]